MFRRIEKAIRTRQENFRRLREICNRTGEIFEQKSFEDLHALSEENFRCEERIFENFTVSFSGTAEIQKNGDLLYILDLHADLPTILGIKPGYHFYKRPDGSVYY